MEQRLCFCPKTENGLRRVRIRFDRAKIQAAGHPVTTVFVITEEGSAKNIQYRTGIDCQAGETEIVTFE